MSTWQTIPPHGGKLIDLVLPPQDEAREREAAQNLPKVAIGTRELSDLEMMAVGRSRRSRASWVSGTTGRCWTRCTWRTACPGRSR